MAGKENGVKTVSVENLVESPFWCRRFVEDEDFLELVESVRNLGVIEPPIVRLNSENKLEIVAGHRRWLAAKKAELETILVIVEKISDEQAMEFQLCENIHRKDLSDFEKAMFLKKMIDKFGYTHLQLAKKVNKSGGWVSNHLRMLQLDTTLSQESMEKLGEAHARTILTMPEPKREEVIEKVEEAIKETGKPPTIKQIQNMTQIPECERCHTHSSTVKPEKINGKPRNLCEKCSQHAKLHPEELVSHFRFLEQVKQGKVPEKLKPKPQETWEFQKSRMKVSPSKMDDMMDILLRNSEKLRKAGWRVEAQVAYEKIICKSDHTLINEKQDRRIAIFYDFPETHKNKDFEDDAKRMEAAIIHKFVPLPLSYNAVTETESVRLLKEIEAKALQEEA